MEVSLIYVLSQIFTILMYVFLAWTYFLKDKRKIVLVDLASLAANILAYILLGAWTGMAMCFVALFRNFYILWEEKCYGKLVNNGVYGYVWASSAATFTNATTADAYFLVFYTTESSPAHEPSVRWGGFPLRCLAD